MTTPVNNPFVLPGMGQGPGGNPLTASMEMMRQAWSSLAGAGGLAQSMTMTPPLSLEELERRIADLRTVESWLQMNLSLLSSSIQGLEVQRATISTLRAFADGMASMPPGQDASPLEVLLGLRPGKGTDDAQRKGGEPRADEGQGRGETAAEGNAGTAAQEPPEPQGTPPQGDASATRPAAPNAPAPDSVAAASQAWWNLLQQQFDQIAAATAASMPQGAAMQGAAPRPTSTGAAPDKAAASGDAGKDPAERDSQSATPAARRAAAKRSATKAPGRSTSGVPAARKRAAARKRGGTGSSSS